MNYEIGIAQFISLSKSVTKSNVTLKERLFYVLNQHIIDMKFDINTFYKINAV
jgi:hypothetical protein